MPLLASGSGLRSSAFLSPRVHGTKRPAKRTRYVGLLRDRDTRDRQGRGKGGGEAGGEMWTAASGRRLCTCSNHGFYIKLLYVCTNIFTKNNNVKDNFSSKMLSK
jgi:hypothetical protein